MTFWDKTGLTGCLMLCGGLIPLSAQADPFVDGDLPLVAADNDPDLFVVRERYNPQTREQSIYLRFNDATADHEIVNGTIRLSGVTISDVYFAGEALAAEDAQWGIPGVDYGPAEVRGLEGAPLLHTPGAEDTLDAIRIETPSRLKFWFGTERDIDDLRIIISYPLEPGSASFSVELYHPGRADPRDWPLTSQAGIKIGSQGADVVPDDGDYSEVFEVLNIKLQVEDLDVVEDALMLGHAPTEGALLGPAVFHIDNFSEGDVDQDNGFDLNGQISPIPASAPLDHLRWESTDLRHTDGDRVPADAVFVEGLAPSLALGERTEAEVSVDVPAGHTPGLYGGWLHIFEDNDGDGVRRVGEANGSVRLWLRIDPPDAGPDAGEVDSGLPDQGPPLPDAATLEDAEIDASSGDPDAGLDASSGDPDAGLDASSGDPDAGLDATTDADAAPDSSDSALDADDAAPDAFDAAPDTADLGHDGGDARPDAADVNPDVTRLDPDASDAAAPGLDDLGDPQGGALDCALGHAPAPAPALMLLLCALLAFTRRRT